MLSKERILSRLNHLGAGGADKLHIFAKSRVFERALYLAMGFAFSLAALTPGVAPFGLAFAAVCRQDALFASAGAFLGYALKYQTGGLIYAAAVMVCFGCRVVLKNTQWIKSLFAMPLCALVALVCTKSVVAVAQGVTGILLLVIEGVVCAGFGLLYQIAERPARYKGRIVLLWARLAVAAAGLLLLAPIRLLGDISLSRTLAGFIIMAVSARGGSALGAGVGGALGVCMDLSGGGGPFFAAVYGFAGLAGGWGGQKSRFTCATCHVLANSVASMWGYANAAAMPGLFECFIASVIFVILPDSLFERIAIQSRQPVGVVRTGGQRAVALGKLQSVSDAIGDLSTALEGQWGKRGNMADISKIYNRAAEGVCRKCPTAYICWEREYVDTRQVLGDTTALLQSRNYLQPQDFAPHFAARCPNLSQFVGTVNEEYRTYLRRLAHLKRDAEARALMSRQYSSLQGILSDMAGSVSAQAEYYPALEKQVKGIARAYCNNPRVAVYEQGGRMQVEIAAEGEGALSDEQAFLQSLSLALKKSFWSAKSVPAKNGRLMRFSEKESFAVNVKNVTRKKPGEAVCGDTSMSIHTDDGRAMVLLSDGMGTGAEASAMSQKALELIAGFVKSGCSLIESTRAVLPVLAARFDQWGFVTLDLLEINLFTGEGGLLKLGAAPSFLIRDGRAGRIQSGALPAGLGPLEESELRPISLRLEQGDQIIMMSDGIWETAGAERIIQENADQDNMGTMLISAAVEEGGADDMTVIVVNVLENRE